MRQLKFHEKKLLRKVDFLQWKSEDNVRELQVRGACLCVCLPLRACLCVCVRALFPRHSS